MIIRKGTIQDMPSVLLLIQELAEFEKEPKTIKQKWAWISFGVVTSIILLLIFSFWIMTNSIK